MIRLADVVRHLSANCPSFASVEHALTSDGQEALPSALVAPMRNAFARPGFFNSPSQDGEQTIAVYVQADRSRDMGPDYPLAELFDDLCEEIRDAMLGWMAPGATAEFFYLGGELAPYRGDGPVIWREDFVASSEVSK